MLLYFGLGFWDAAEIPRDYEIFYTNPYLGTYLHANQLYIVGRYYPGDINFIRLLQLIKLVK